ncbi:MAG: reactive intermediate/imine deaminase [Rhodovulum sulfidophilum]|uniref:Reactive intermediate/imine deaminase n=1 Tax=Rhodovulum sulfidophilum TaxID=35806 RepID=A0A2W5PSA5_RHOSU|nr:MAG: reactive intermediate/imine deaminase [Rhodovulum sulfidophilum]
MREISTTDAPVAAGPYSQAIRTGDLLFVSGQLPIDPATGAIPEDVLEQTRRSLANIAAIARGAGTDLAKTVKTTVFVTDIARFDEINGVYASFFSAPFPARSLYQVAALPKGAQVEIEAVIEI